MSIKTRLAKLEPVVSKYPYITSIHYVDIDNNVVDKIHVIHFNERECVTIDDDNYNEYKAKYENMNQNTNEFIDWKEKMRRLVIKDW